MTDILRTVALGLGYLVLAFGAFCVFVTILLGMAHGHGRRWRQEASRMDRDPGDENDSPECYMPKVKPRITVRPVELVAMHVAGSSDAEIVDRLTGGVL